jgi:hypothetical protein
MRTKVTINLSTEDPLEAEILDMLSTIPSSHRRQERLRNFLKAGYNMFYKNMGPEQAMTEAFDSHDVALILSLFRNAGGVAPVAPAVASIPVTVQHSESPPAYQNPPADRRPPPSQEPTQRAPEAPRAQREPVKAPMVKMPALRGYKEVSGVLEDVDTSGENFVDVDPGILEPSSQSDIEIPAIIDPMLKLFGK